MSVVDHPWELWFVIHSARFFYTYITLVEMLFMYKESFVLICFYLLCDTIFGLKSHLTKQALDHFPKSQRNQKCSESLPPDTVSQSSHTNPEPIITVNFYSHFWHLSTSTTTTPISVIPPRKNYFPVCFKRRPPGSHAYVCSVMGVWNRQEPWNDWVTRSYEFPNTYRHVRLSLCPIHYN